ncbi:MAG: hypothetical protein KDE27_32005 [Planctomycetes bacterium]|nr:hypothetical protein [Planctomycetota bacterium]
MTANATIRQNLPPPFARLRPWIGAGGGAAFLVLLPGVVLEAVGRGGHGGCFVAGLLVLVAGVAAFALGAVLAPFWRHGAGLCVAGIAVLAVWFTLLLLARQARSFAFARCAARAGDLVGAIERYRQIYGHAPDRLAELVPTLLSAVPGTGMPAYPEFDYARLPAKPGAPTADPDFELTISCPTAFLSFDLFVYQPLAVEQRVSPGWSRPRYGDWIYVAD